MKDEDKPKERLISPKPDAYPIRIKPYFLFLGIIWTLVVSVSLIVKVYQTRQDILDVARGQARVAHETDAIYLRWNAMHGGVYVPVTEKSAPNPDLEVPERDITTPPGVALTKLNPAYMARQVHEMAAEAYGVRGHITSLNPIRPANAPDSWETEALLAFRGGAEEISSVEEIQGQPYLRFMRPLFTENTCLSCHAVQGYRLGDIRGGISVSLPMNPFLAKERSRILTLFLRHTLLWLLGLVGVGFGARRLAEQITERKHAEESLKQNRNRLEQINDCLLELGPDHNSNINRLTSLCGELLGGTCALYNRLDGGMLCSKGRWQTPPDFKTKDTPEGHICYDLIRGNEEDVMLVTDLPLTSYGESDPNVRAYGLQTYFGRVVKSEGKRVGSLCVVYRIDYRPGDEDRQVLGIIASAIGNEDRRRQAEEALREREATHSQIIEFLPDAILVIDKDGKVLAWNRTMEAMTGVKAEEMIGKGNHEYSLPFYGNRRPILIDFALRPNPEMEKHCKSIQRRGDIIFGEAFTPGLPPGNVHLSATASVLRDSKGDVIAAIECIRDTTEWRSLEERLQRGEKMEALGTLAGGVAHDLNNVLGIVVGYSELLLDDLDESSPARLKTMQILKGGQRAAAIVQDLLTLARRGVPSRKVLNLNNIFFEFQNSPEFAQVFSYHPNIEMKTDLEADLLNVSGSSVHLEKSFLNLVSNAAEAMPNGGTLTVKTANRYLDKPISGYDEVREGDYVVLSLSDTGEGIPASDMKRIFEPFYTKKVMGRSGTGLGLAVVWGTVKDHLGYINVESEEGKGTTFTLYLPVTREEISKEQVSISAGEYMGNGESILVVDDVKEQRELAGMMLKRLNYTIVSVSSGEEAVKYVREHAVDLIVLDMIMDPGMDGLDTYARIVEIHPRQKAIIVSGFSETERVSKAQSLGAGAYVKKPYVMEKLGLAVRKELGRPA